MKHTAKALLLSLTVTTAAAALIIPVATAETVAETPDFKTFEATPKAPRKEPVKERQIVVEPKEEIAPKTETTPVANLTDPVETVDTKQPEPKQELVESTGGNEDKPAIEDKPGLDEDTFAPKTKADADKVEMPTVFTDKQKELFNKLDAEQQADLVKKLVKKHGYDTMYPKKVTRKYLDDYRTKQSKSDDDYYDQGGYGDTGHYGNQGSYTYGSSYGTSYQNCPKSY